MSTLDSKYKLTTFKGMTVPQGYASGAMSDYEALEYLQKLGIDETLYLDLAMKAVQVPRGFLVISPNKNEYRPGRFVPTASGETTWEDFQQNAPSRDWTIEESQEEEDLPEEVFSDSEEYSLPEGFSGSGIRDALGRNYTIPMLKTVADFYNMELQREREMANGDKSRLADLDAYEKEIAETLNSMVDEYLARRLIYEEAQGSEAYGEDVISEVRTIVSAYPNTAAYETTNRTGITKEGKPNAGFSLTAKVVVRDKGNKDRKDIHFGALLGALHILSKSGNSQAQAYLDKLRDDSQSKSAGATVVVRIRDLFPESVPSAEAYNLFYSILDKSAIKSDNAESENAAALQAAIRLAQHMMPPKEGSVQEQKQKIREQELFLKLEKNLVLAKSSKNTSKEIKEIIGTIEQLRLSREMIDSISSGNFTVQMAIDMGLSAFGTPNRETVELILSRLDNIFAIKGSSDTFTGIFKSFIKDGENIEEQFENLRGILKQKIDASGIILKGGKRQGEFTVKEQKNLFFELSSVLSGNINEFISDSILSKSVQGDNHISVRGLLLPKFGYQALMDNVFPKITKKMSSLLSKKPPELSVGDFLRSSRFRAEMGDFLKKDIGIDDELSNKVFDSMLHKAKIYESVLSSAFGSGSVSSRMPEYAARGFSAMLAYTIQSHASKFHDGMAMMSKAALTMTSLLFGNPEGYNSRTGSFFNQENHLFSEFLTRLRVMPHINSDGDISWDKGTKEFVLSKYLERYGNNGELVDDKTLAKFMSHMEENIPSHYLLTSNLHNRAKDIIGQDGDRILNDEEHSKFIRDVQSTNLSDSKELVEAADSLESMDRLTKTLASGKLSTPEMSREMLLSDEFLEETKDYSLTSLANALRNTQGLTETQVNKMWSSYQSAVRERIMSSSPEYGEAISEYVTSSFKGDVNRGGLSTIGHALESISSVPMIIHHMQKSGATNISGSRIDDISGISWTGSDGSTYTFGGIKNSQNGTIDYMAIKDSPEGFEIFPGEGKMESKGGVVPHHGTPDNFIAFASSLWKGDQKKMKIHPTVALNMPHQGTDASASYFSLSMNYVAEDIQSSGRTFSHGSLDTVDTLRRKVTR